jgi:hypothetical protein
MRSYRIENKRIHAQCDWCGYTTSFERNQFRGGMKLAENLTDLDIKRIDKAISWEKCYSCKQRGNLGKDMTWEEKRSLRERLAGYKRSWVTEDDLIHAELMPIENCGRDVVMHAGPPAVKCRLCGKTSVGACDCLYDNKYGLSRGSMKGAMCSEYSQNRTVERFMTSVRERLDYLRRTA